MPSVLGSASASQHLQTSQHPQKVPAQRSGSNICFISNLPPIITEQDLIYFLSQYGVVDNLMLSEYDEASIDVEASRTTYRKKENGKGGDGNNWENENGKNESTNEDGDRTNIEPAIPFFNYANYAIVKFDTRESVNRCIKALNGKVLEMLGYLLGR